MTDQVHKDKRSVYGEATFKNFNAQGVSGMKGIPLSYCALTHTILLHQKCYVSQNKFPLFINRVLFLKFCITYTFFLNDWWGVLNEQWSERRLKKKITRSRWLRKLFNRTETKKYSRKFTKNSLFTLESCGWWTHFWKKAVLFAKILGNSASHHMQWWNSFLTWCTYFHFLKYTHMWKSM